MKKTMMALMATMVLMTGTTAMAAEYQENCRRHAPCIEASQDCWGQRHGEQRNGHGYRRHCFEQRQVE